MHIEKINDHQIKCVLSERDLKMRDLDLNELAYGTDKARSLFREMIEQAHETLGFETEENMPLMVEAIPVSQNSIILLITRIDNPDELDTRFSRFSQTSQEDEINDDAELAGADEILDLFREPEAADNLAAVSADLSDIAPKAKGFSDGSPEEDPFLSAIKETVRIMEDREPAAPPRPMNLLRIYSFDSLDTIIDLAQILHPLYNGVNDLYKDPDTGTYYLVLRQSHHTPEDFNKTCNIASEYGSRQKSTDARAAFFREHFECIVEQTALQRLFLF